jgi:hypothetical protein
MEHRRNAEGAAMPLEVALVAVLAVVFVVRLAHDLKHR